MAQFMKLEFKGADDIIKKFAGATDRIKKEALQPALKAITDEIASEAKKNLRYFTNKTKNSKSAGELEKHIKSVASPRDSKGDAIARATIIRRPRKQSLASYLIDIATIENLSKKYAKINKSGTKVRIYAYYAHMLEYGHKIIKNGKQVGYSKARPFFRLAVRKVSRKANEIIQLKVNEIVGKIDKE